jgi:general secretion pathway protein D
VQYIEVGLTVEVQPTIHNDGNVAIKVALEVSTIVNKISVPIGNGGTTLAYEIGTRNSSTLLQLKDGETQVLAGLIQDSDQKTSTHIPGLGDLPVIGRLFGSKGTTRDKTEIVMSITPRIIRTQPRPSSETTEFWYGTESQTRSAPFQSGNGTAPAAPAGAAAPGGMSFGAGAGAGSAPPAITAPPAPPAPVSSAPHAVPARIEASAGPPPPPPSPPPAGAAAAGTPEAKVAAAKPAETAAAEGSEGAPPAPTDNKPKVTIEGPETAKIGDEVSVTVRLASSAAFGRVRTQVGFDAAALQLVSAEPGDLAPSGEVPKVETKPGGVQVEFAGSEGAPVSGSGSLISLRFRVVAARPALQVATQVVLVGEDGVALAATQATPLKINVAP